MQKRIITLPLGNLEENKFGLNPWEFEEVLEVLCKCNHLKLVGLQLPHRLNHRI